MSKKEREEIKKKHKRKELKKMIRLWVWVMLAYAIFASVAIVLIKNKISIDQKNEWNLGWTILSFEFLHFALSFSAVGSMELGAILFFGRPLYQVKSGLVYRPFIVCQLVKDSKTVVPLQFPGPPERIDKSGDDTKSVKPGFVKPIRVTTASRDMLTQENLDKLNARNDDFKKYPLNDMLTVEPEVFLRYQRRPDDYISFLSHIGDDRRVLIAIRDTVDAVLRIEFAKRTATLILMEQDEINKELLNKIEILVGERADPKNPDSFDPEESWGINVLNVQLTNVDLGRTLNQTLRDVVNSQFQRTTDITIADGKKRVRELEGEGEGKYETERGKGLASARLDFLNAEAEGLKKIAEVAETEEGKLAVVAKATEQGLKGSQYSIVPDGAGSLITGIMEVLKKTGSREISKKTEGDLKENKGGKK